MQIRAVKPFTHQDRAFSPGDVAQASASAGKWLIAQGVAEEVQPERPEKVEKPDKADKANKALKP